MKIGDLVTVKPAKVGVHLIIGEDPDRENNWPTPTGVILGRLYELYNPYEERIVDMHEKWIEVISES
jgi:hypothetical protein|tara:strand:+ start:642 stop:842 length:201 start_codon:yes stop_codon:yes gene_type:complete